MVASVEDDSIASHQAAHHRGDRRGAGLQQQVEVVRDKCPGETASRGLFEDMAETRDKMVAIDIVVEDSSFDTAADYVVNGPRGVYALSRHADKLATGKPRGKTSQQSPFYPV